jgi:hypothetical protein
MTYDPVRHQHELSYERRQHLTTYQRECSKYDTFNMIAKRRASSLVRVDNNDARGLNPTFSLLYEDTVDVASFRCRVDGKGIPLW